MVQIGCALRVFCRADRHLGQAQLELAMQKAPNANRTQGEKAFWASEWEQP